MCGPDCSHSGQLCDGLHHVSLIGEDSKVVSTLIRWREIQSLAACVGRRERLGDGVVS